MIWNAGRLIALRWPGAGSTRAPAEALPDASFPGTGVQAEFGRASGRRGTQPETLPEDYFEQGGARDPSRGEVNRGAVHIQRAGLGPTASPSSIALVGRASLCNGALSATLDRVSIRTI